MPREVESRHNGNVIEPAQSPPNASADGAIPGGFSKMQSGLAESDTSPFTSAHPDIASSDTDVWNSPQWNRFSLLFDSDKDSDNPRRGTSKRRNQPRQIAIWSRSTSMPVPSQLESEEPEYFDPQTLDEAAIEIVNLESLVNSGEETNTSKMTAATLLTLFTTKDEQRRKLKKLSLDASIQQNRRVIRDCEIGSVFCPKIGFNGVTANFS